MKKLVFVLVVALAAMLSCGAAFAGYVSGSSSEMSVPVSGSGWNAYLGGFDYAANGNIIAYSGQSVLEMNATSGEVIRTLYTSPTTLASSFVKVDQGSGKIYFGESSNGTINVMDSDGSNQRNLTTIAFNYDMVVGPGGKLLVSSCDSTWSTTYLYSLDSVTGAATQFGTFAGPSGPLALGADGSLYYGSASSNRNVYGTERIVSWSASQLSNALAGSMSLSAGNATNVITGTDNVNAMAFNGNGELYYTTSQGWPSAIWKVSNGAQSRIATSSTDGFYWLTTLRYSQANNTFGVNVGGLYDENYNALGLIATMPAPEPSALLALASFAGVAFAGMRRRRTL